MKVTGLRVSIEKMQHMFVLYQYLAIEHALVREGITHHPVRVRVELKLIYGEARDDQETTISRII